MNKSLTVQIKESIEAGIRAGKKEFIIFPYGDVGMLADQILSHAYGIKASHILDNGLCLYNPYIKPLSILKDIDKDKYCLLFCCTNVDIYDDLRDKVLQYYPQSELFELSSMTTRKIQEDKEISAVANTKTKYGTRCGKYSYGPLCDHPWVESIGAFCSVNYTVDVVTNKPRDFISLSPFLYADKKVTKFSKDYNEYECERWYFPDVTPLHGDEKRRRITVGNDVWLGKMLL